MLIVCRLMLIVCRLMLIVGYPVLDITLDMREGLNLVGLAIFDDKEIEDVIIQSPSDYSVREIGSRNNDGSYDLAVYYPSEDDWFMVNELDIEVGKGYWVKANNDLNLMVVS